MECINRVALKSQVIFEILAFIDSREVLKFQLLNTKFYLSIIPQSIKYVRSVEPYTNAAIFYEDSGVIYRVTCKVDPNTKNKTTSLARLGLIGGGFEKLKL